MRVPLTGFAPDLDPTTVGVVVDCDGIVPTVQGLAAAASLANAGMALWPGGTPTGAYMTQLLDGSKRMFGSTITQIIEATSLTWTDRSRFGGYTGTQRQRFCVFGNNVLATNRTQVIGQAAPGGVFVDIAGAPQASIIVSVAGFVMALDTSDATFGNRPDGWWSSGLRDQTQWAPSLATQAANGRLIDSPGKIVAGAALGDVCVAYKETSMYQGRYVGAPVIWSWTRVPGDIGALGAEAVVSFGPQQFFIGLSDFYAFSGIVPESIGQDVREWFFRDLNLPHRAKIIGAVDIPRSLIYWYYPSITSDTGALDSVLIYNTLTGKFGLRRLAVQVPVLYVSGAVTYHSLGALYATYDALPTTAYDSPFWLSDQTVPGVFQNSILYSLTGAPGASWLRTGDFGDMTGWGFMRRVTPRYRTTPTSGTATNYYRATLGEAAVTDATSTLRRSRFDFRRSARWHSIRIDHTSTAVLDGIDVDLLRITPE